MSTLALQDMQDYIKLMKQPKTENKREFTMMTSERSIVMFNDAMQDIVYKKIKQAAHKAVN